MYLLGVRPNQLPGQIVFSDSVEVENTGVFGDLLEINIGVLYVNNTNVGQSAYVNAGDIIQVRLNSPNTAGQSTAAVVKQQGQVVGYFAVITENSFEFTYETRYNDLFSFEAIPEEDWTTTAPVRLKSFTSDGVAVDDFDLTQIIAGSTNRNLLSLDYHRDCVYAFDTTAGGTIRILNGGGPVSEVSFYDADEIKAGVAIAYNKDGVIRFYNSNYDFSYSIPLPNVGYIAYYNNKFYAAAKHGTTLYSWDFNTTTLQLTNPIEQVFADEITYLIHNNNQLIVASGPGLYDSTASLLLTLNSPVRSACVRPGTSSLYATHGAENYVSAITDQFGLSQINITQGIFLDTIEVQANGRIYVNDIENKKVYVRGVNNQDWETEFPGFGIALSNFVYILDSYSDIPSKVITEDLEYNLDSSDFVDIEGVLVGDDVTTGNLVLNTSNKAINVRALPSEDYVTLLKNGVPVSDVTTISQGDTLAFNFDYIPELANPTVFAVIIDQVVYDLVVYGDTQRIIPDEFVFTAQNGVPVNSLRTSNEITVSGLERPIEVTSEDADIIVNGNVVAQPFTIYNGDVVSMRVLSSEENCDTTIGKLFIEDRFVVPFSVSTFTSGTATLPIMEFEDTFDLPLGRVVESPILVPENFYTPVEFTIPELYDAVLMRNGVNVGRTATFTRGDSLRIRLTTTYNYDTPHHVTLQSCYGEFSWVAWTVGDNVPDSFDFGIILDLSIKDFVQSEIVTITGIGNNVLVPIRFPYSTRPIINGNLLSIPEHLLDFRGVLLRDYRVFLRISVGTTIQLEGYARPIHGDANELSVFIGGRRGDWTLVTWNTLAPAIETSYLTGVEQPVMFSQLVQHISENSILVPSNQVFSKSSSNQVTASSTRKTTVTVSANRTAARSNKASITNPQVFSTNPPGTVVLESNDPMYSERNINYWATSPNYTFLNFEYAYQHNGGHVNLFENTALYDLSIEANRFNKADRNEEYEFNTYNQIKFGYIPDYTHWTHAALVGEVALAVRLDAIVFSPSYFNLAQTSFKVLTYSFYSVKMKYQKESVHFNISDQIKVNPVYESYIQKDRVEYTPVYVHSDQPGTISYVPEYVKHISSEFTAYDPVYSCPTQPDAVLYVPKYVFYSGNPTFSYAGSYTKTSEGRVASVDLGVGITYHSNLFTIGDTSTVHNDSSFHLVEALSKRHGYAGSYITSDVRAVSPEADECSLPFLQAEVSALDSEDKHEPYLGELHPGYFATHAEAVADAYSYDMENGMFYTIQIPGRGWAWTMVIECANMCNPNDCPPSGYIHGG